AGRMAVSGLTWAETTFHRSRKPACSTLPIPEMRMKMRPTPPSLQLAGRGFSPSFCKHTFADDQLMRGLRVVPRAGESGRVVSLWTPQRPRSDYQRRAWPYPAID